MNSIYNTLRAAQTHETKARLAYDLAVKRRMELELQIELAKERSAAYAYIRRSPHAGNLLLVYDVICQHFLDTGYFPTAREIATGAYMTDDTAGRYVRALIDIGAIERDYRIMRLVDLRAKGR